MSAADLSAYVVKRRYCFSGAAGNLQLLTFFAGYGFLALEIVNRVSNLDIKDIYPYNKEIGDENFAEKSEICERINEHIIIHAGRTLSACICWNNWD